MRKTCVVALAALVAGGSATAADQSFREPKVWGGTPITKFWSPELHERMLADVDNDGMQDVVGFGREGVWIGRSTGDGFDEKLQVEEFGNVTGWYTKWHVRRMADITGDGFPDIVGFGRHGVFTAVNQSVPGLPRFSDQIFALDNFGTDQAWTSEKHTRVLADLNHDRRMDIVAFGDHGTWTALSNGDGTFQQPVFAVADFGYLQGWRVDLHVRLAADVSGDGFADVVGFGDHGTWVARGNGNGTFQQPVFAFPDLGYNQGWRTHHPRRMVDLDADGRLDVVAFGDTFVFVARGTAAGLAAPSIVLADSTDIDVKWGGHSARFVADLNADDALDLFGAGPYAITRALGVPGPGFVTQRPVLRALTSGQGYHGLTLAGDVTGDGMTDLVAFDSLEILVAVSTDESPRREPKAPSDTRLSEVTEESVTVGWTDNSDDERSFVINVSPDGGALERATADADADKETVTGLESETRHCFTVQAENLWGISGKSRVECVDTDKESTPPPPPPPPPVGVKALQVFNCITPQRPLFLWTFDHTTAQWEQRGELAPHWQGSGCPGNNMPFQFSLEDGHTFTFVAVDSGLGGCSGNNPADDLCQARRSGPILGKSTGVVQIQTVG